LYRRLQEWYAGAVHRPDEKLDTTLPSPELPVTGQSPRTLGTFTVMLWNIFVVVVLTVFSALLVGLPFSHMTAEGTLAIVSAVLITSVEGLPFWFYREAQPRTAGER
jgi:hypothetical protein